MAGSTLRTLGLSRRAAIVMASGAFAGAGVRSVGTQASDKTASPLREPCTRVVAVDASGGPGAGSFGVQATLKWAVSQVETVGLIAVSRRDIAISANDAEFAQDWARHHSCHVALVGEETVVIGPTGRLAAQVVESGLPAFSTEVGVIAVRSESDQDIPPFAEIVIQTGAHHDCAIPKATMPDVVANRCYVLDLSAGQDEKCVGPMIYESDGGVMTQAAAGWGQGVTAMLDISALRRVRASRVGHSA
ncbi:MAG: hypothetical protein HOH20_15225 [Rhodospirillaceae bacterium]|nr:hypothetical protein [Rhodospirillaceae bacterium]